MKNFGKVIAQSIRNFWMIELTIKGKKWFIGSIISASLIVGILITIVYYYGLIGLLIIGVKQGIKVLFAMLAKVTVKTLLMLGLKRAFIDGVVSPQLKKFVFPVLGAALIARLKHSGSYFGRLVGKILALLGTIGVIVASIFVGGWAFLKWLLGLAVTKVATIFGFKSLWVILGKAWFWIKTTPFGMLIQVYVLSVLMDILGRLIPDRLKKRMQPIIDWFVKYFWKVQGYLDKLFGWHLEKNIKKIARWIEPPAERQKRRTARLKEALRQKQEKQKEKQKKHPGSRITRFRKTDQKLDSRFCDQKKG